MQEIESCRLEWCKIASWFRGLVQEENVRRKAAEKTAKSGGRGSDKAAGKKPWWQDELDAAAAAKRTSKAEDDISAYRDEVCCLGCVGVPRIREDVPVSVDHMGVSCWVST